MAVNHPNLAAAAAAAVMMVVMATAGAAVIAPMLPATGPRTYCYCRRDCQRYDGVRGGAGQRRHSPHTIANVDRTALRGPEPDVALDYLYVVGLLTKLRSLSAPTDGAAEK